MVLVGNVHLIQGTDENIADVIDRVESEGYSVRGSFDVYVRTYAQFGIDEARELRERATTRSFVSAARIFIVATPVITIEAQNALLKTLEEPPAGALFFIVVPSPDTLLPTLRSRAQMLEISSRVKSAEVVDTREFLAASPAARLELLRPLLDKGEDDRRDMSAVVTFLSSLERTIHKRATDGALAEGLRAIYRAKQYASDKGSMVKPLLESVALLVPIMKT
jgi:DNA polymerase III gamma/tau subunit